MSSTTFVPTYPSTPYESIPADQLDALHQADGKVRLFNNIICPFGQRALWTALEINAPFEVIEVSLSDKPASYEQQFNRYGTVPYLLDDGFAVYESAIVAQFLDSKYGHGKLQRKDDPRAASLAQLVSAKFEARPFYTFLRSGDAKDQADLREILTELETIYSKHANAYRAQGPFLLGADISSAEINIVPFLFRFDILLNHYRKVNVLADFPLLHGVLNAAKARPAFQRSVREPEYYIQAYSKYVAPASNP